MLTDLITLLNRDEDTWVATRLEDLLGAQAKLEAETESVSVKSYFRGPDKILWELLNLGCVHYQCYEDRELLDQMKGRAYGIATIGPLTFDAPTHVGASDTITGFGICQATTTPYADCEEGQGASAGEIFSVINSADRTLETSETVDITYTFDISSSGA